MMSRWPAGRRAEGAVLASVVADGCEQLEKQLLELVGPEGPE
jgi:hypothetical protein